jgi:hypothetical protein
MRCAWRWTELRDAVSITTTRRQERATSGSGTEGTGPLRIFPTEPVRQLAPAGKNLLTMNSVLQNRTVDTHVVITDRAGFTGRVTLFGQNNARDGVYVVAKLSRGDLVALDRELLSHPATFLSLPHFRHPDQKSCRAWPRCARPRPSSSHIRQ